MEIFKSGIFIFGALVLCGVFGFDLTAIAITGSIDSVSHYAWTENAGWLDFGTSQGGVAVGDSALSGYAWGENIGWVSLNCSNTSSCAAADYKVANDINGNLSGYAWTENAGWINFAPTGGGVSIGSNGEFSGYAWGENIGWVVFNCATTDSCAEVDYKVKTDWLPLGARSVAANGQPGQSSAAVGAQKNLAWAKPFTAPSKISITPELRKLILSKIAEILVRIGELQKQLDLLLAAKR